MLYTVIWRAKSGLILLNLSCYIQQEAEETFCILSHTCSTFEGLVFQKKLQLASNFFSILFSIQIPRNFLFILWKFLIIETRAVFKKEYGVRFQHVFLSNPLENGTVSVTCQYKLYRWHSEVTSVAEYFSMSSHLYISLLKHCIEKKSWVCCNFWLVSQSSGSIESLGM